MTGEHVAEGHRAVVGDGAVRRRAVVRHGTEDGGIAAVAVELEPGGEVHERTAGVEQIWSRRKRPLLVAPQLMRSVPTVRLGNPEGAVNGRVFS